jgi:hypothetical protein
MEQYMTMSGEFAAMLAELGDHADRPQHQD